MIRRGMPIMKMTMAVFAVGLLIPAAAADPPAAAGTPRPPITKLYLFVHCLGDGMDPVLTAKYVGRWRELFAREAANPANAICMLSSGTASLSVAEEAKRAFGDRCFIDPRDDSVDTRMLIVRDLQHAFGQRGMNGEWTPYEMWTATNARRWSEGLKVDFRSRGLTYDPATLRVVACGRAWGGCLAKYPPFMSRYLGLEHGAEILAELSPHAGFPVAAEFRECIALDRHVLLFLFVTADGRPMAQFFDGLRGVAEPPHVATIPLDASRAQLLSVTPNVTQAVQRVANPLESGGLMVDVCDGCRPVLTTVLGKQIDYAAFRAAVAKATITPFARRHDAITTYRPGCDMLCPAP
jgi:hypothetical protein